MIRYLTNQEIDKDKWDKCIDNSVNCLIYAYSWYLDIVAEHWDALVEDDYISVFPLTYSIKYGVAYLHQPFFTQQLGVFSENTFTDISIGHFLTKIPTKFKFVEINLNYLNENIPNQIVRKQNVNCELSLKNSYDDIYKNYSTNTKRNLNKAQKSNLYIRRNVDVKLVIDLFKNNKGKEVSTLKDEQYKILETIVKDCSLKEKAEVAGVYSQENQLSAGLVILKHKNRNIFLFSGSNNKAKETGSMFYLIDNYIKILSEQDMVFDFEGSNNKNLANFYKGFGAEEHYYYRITKNCLPLHIKPFFWFYKWLKKQ